jgi:hypothetical protein
MREAKRLVRKYPWFIKYTAEQAGQDYNAWLHDCYCTYQTKHTFGEVLRWFNENEIEYIGSNPNRFGENDFLPWRFLNQLEMAIRRKDAMWIIGRKITC